MTSLKSKKVIPSLPPLPPTPTQSYYASLHDSLSPSLMPHESYLSNGMAFTTTTNSSNKSTNTTTTTSGKSKTPSDDFDFQLQPITTSFPPKLSSQIPRTSTINLSPVSAYFPLDSTPIITTNIHINDSGIAVKSSNKESKNDKGNFLMKSLSIKSKNKKKLNIIPPPASQPTLSIKTPLSATAPSPNTISSWRAHTPPPIPTQLQSQTSDKMNRRVHTPPPINTSLGSGYNSIQSTPIQTASSSSPSNIITHNTPKFLLLSTKSPHNEAVKAVSFHAKFYQDKDIQYKLKLLMTSPTKLDDIIDNGFPLELSKTDLSLVQDDYEEPPKRKFSASSASSSSSWKRQQDSYSHHSHIPPVPPITIDNGKVSFDNSPGASTNPSTPSSISSPYPYREMTLKITLTPASMRADEETIYGWQRDHIDSGTVKSLTSVMTDDENENTYSSFPPPLQPPMTPATMTNFSSNASSPEGPPIKPYKSLVSPSSQTSFNQESSFIPAGGLGSDVSSKKMVKRVFGKLRRQKTVNPALMITSSD